MCPSSICHLSFALALRIGLKLKNQNMRFGFGKWLVDEKRESHRKIKVLYSAQYSSGRRTAVGRSLIVVAVPSFRSSVLLAAVLHCTA
jgi:hypothetical protein